MPRVWYFSVETLVWIEAIKTERECHNSNLDNIEKQSPTNSVKIPTRFLLPFLCALFPTFYVLYFLLC